MNKKIIDNVFHSYDIRGLISEGLDEDFYTELGKAYVTKFQPKKIILGHDIRPESEIFKNALSEGVMEMGCDVVDVGEIATEMLYFGVGEYAHIYDGGMVVTASHNPAGWNGCKIVTHNAKPVGKATGLFDIKDLMHSEDYKPVKETHGHRGELDLYPAFKDKVLSFITAQERKPLSVIVDAGNGIGGKIFDYVFDELNLDVHRMYFVPDGNFPNHVPDPLKEENVAEIKERVLSEDVDFGIAIDGDSDRVFFIDQKGRCPNGVYTGVLLAKHILKTSDNKKVIHDPRVTWPFVKEGVKIGAETFPSIAGHSYFKQKMAEEEAVFGAESSSHFFYQDFYNCDSGMISIAIMLDMYYQGFELTKEVDYLFETYPNSGEVNYKVDDADETISKIEKHYIKQNPKVEKIDGVSIEFDDWRFNLRKSNTQPLIRLNVEATDVNTVVEKFLEVEELIGAERDNIPGLAELR